MDLLRRAYVGSERLIVLVRLHLLATRLELPELADIAYAALVEWEGQVRAKDCVAFAPFIFDQYPGQSGTEALKDWYVALMKRHRKKLRSLPSWERALEASHSSLAVSWAKWMGSLGAKRTLNTPGREGNTRNLGGTLLNSTISTTSVSATTNASKESLLSRLLSEESSLEKEQFERKRKGKQLQSPKNHDYIDRYDSEADDEISEEESRPDVHSSGDELALATPYCAIESRKAREILGIKPSDLGGGAGSVENESSSATGGASRKASLHSVAGGHRKVSK
ncbi:hypothetical protein MMC06_003279 [Schaereria dolodes]|nr:hypothetical protein [Schaereria dolodes]